MTKPRDDFPFLTVEELGISGSSWKRSLRLGAIGAPPKNALTFASTGGDGDHFSLLIHDGRVDDKSAVVLTWPSEGINQIVGENLYDFLCLGMHGGYFQIQMVFPEFRPASAPEHWFCDHVDEQQQKLLTFLASELNLKPWDDGKRRERLKRLQDDFLPLVVANIEPD